MRWLRIGLAGAAAAIVALAAAPAVAEDPARFGPPIPGVCLLGRSHVLENADAARAVAGRVRQAETALDSQLSADRARLQGELAGLPASSGDPAIVSRRGSLVEQLAALSRFETEARERIRGQTSRADGAVEALLATALARVITRDRCSLVVERSGIYGWNNAMDVTDQVIEAMNGSPVAAR